MLFRSRGHLGNYGELGLSNYIWTSTEPNPGQATPGTAFFIGLGNTSAEVSWTGVQYKESGLSVRCIKDVTSSNTEFEKMGFQVSPNPAHNDICVFIYNMEANAEFLLFNSIGVVVGSGIIDGNKVDISLENIPAGVYYLKLQIGRAHV